MTSAWINILETGTSQCWSHLYIGRRSVTYHPNAPTGISKCNTCGRFVIRGMGRWWTGKRP